MPNLNTREVLENMFNGTTAIKNQNPRFGQKEYYYINPYLDKQSSPTEKDIAYVDSPDDPNPFLQQQNSMSGTPDTIGTTGLTGNNSLNTTSSLTNDTASMDNNATSLSDSTDGIGATPRTVYQNLTGFRNNNTTWYENNPEKDNINLINDPNRYSSDRNYNDCLESDRFNTLTSNIIENREGKEKHISDQLTKGGIAQSFYNQYRHKYLGYPKSVDKLTDAQVKNIYCHEYYKPGRIEAINNPHLADHIYDMVVNPGYTASAPLMQQAINMFVLPENQIEVDGVLGTDFVTAVNNLTPEQLHNVNNNMADLRKAYYESRDEPEFIKGWINRTEKLRLK